ncbi:MAG: flagellar hook assembly protein FlgD [Planctomycetota bacterium]
MDTITTLAGTNASASSPATSAGAVASTRSQAGEMSSDDFFKLLIAELTNQDPLEPMDNQDLLDQITSIRDIESSASLTESLESLTGQQRLSAVSSIIGQYVMARSNAGGFTEQGIVVAVRFEDDDTVTLTLADGTELPLDEVATIQSPDQAAQSLLGQDVTAIDRRTAGSAAPVQGQVTGLGLDADGGVLLDLNNGTGSARLTDVITGFGEIGDAISQVF